ncbi:MAG: hypothetical protein CME64_09065 [Halobacteriovoraceae bacterium]|nr:hypothetical protein [Halobacteriovoraceae bacterium]
MRLITLLLLMGATAFTHELEFANYLKLQKALAGDDYKTALSVHKTICKKELGHYTDNYSDCGKEFESIKDLRNSFKNLSQLFIGNGKNKELEQLQIMSCSMAKAKWVQKKGDIANPYYGKKMLSCGEKV